MGLAHLSSVSGVYTIQAWEVAAQETAHLGNCTFGQLHIWEAATWENAAWENAFRKVSNIDIITGRRTDDEKKVSRKVWTQQDGVARKVVII